MIATAVCQSYLQEILRGLHQETDVYKIALYSPAATLSKTTTAYTAQDEVVGDGYQAGGRILEGFQVGRDGVVTFVDWKKNPVWPVASITARGALIYNSSRGNRAVVVGNFGRDITSTNAPFEVFLPHGVAEKALIRIRSAS